MAQPNDVKSILDIGADGTSRRKEPKLKDKKKRPGKCQQGLLDLFLDF
jgi:hypothetical protein